MFVQIGMWHDRYEICQLREKPETIVYQCGFKGMLGIVFRKAQNKIQDSAKLPRLIVDLVDKERWLTLDADVNGDAYEGLLQENAEDVRSLASQYITPRPLIEGIVDCVHPQPVETICDPACSTGGFLLMAHALISRRHALRYGQVLWIES